MLNDKKIDRRMVEGAPIRYFLIKKAVGIKRRKLNIQLEVKSNAAFQEFEFTNQNIGGDPSQFHQRRVSERITFIEAAIKKYWLFVISKRNLEFFRNKIDSAIRKIKKSKELRVRILNANSLALFTSEPYAIALRQLDKYFAQQFAL